MLSPETAAKICLSNKLIKQPSEQEFYKKAIVAILDGLIVWIRDINIYYAQPGLYILSRSVGLPVAVIPREAIYTFTKERLVPGTLLSPVIWAQHRVWDSVHGTFLKPIASNLSQKCPAITPINC